MEDRENQVAEEENVVTDEAPAENTPEAEGPQESSGRERAPEKRKKKKFGPVKTSICIVSAAAVAALATWAGIAFGRPQERNDVDAGYGSVSYEVEEGEVFSAASFVSAIKERDENGQPVGGDDGTYDAVDVFGRLNWTFAQQDNWYSEMHSDVHTAIGLQDVATYKRYSNGVLISSDITTSSMVNLAREFCYVGDRVMWRESEDKKENWDGMNTVFPTDAPLGNMNISGDSGFRKLNGLPATELSVYVIEGKTVESAELVPTVSTADGGLYTLTMHLLAKTDEEGKTGAAAYYGNQMVFTGGIDAPPEFKYITVTYTFTENWKTVSCTVAEEYTASMKTIVSTCSSVSETKFQYDVEGLEEEVNEVYESYYKQYADAEVTGPTLRPITATDCLASAFGSVLTQPTTLDLTLTVDGNPLNGKLYLDLGGMSIGGALDISKLEARLTVGNALSLWLKDGTAYVKYSNVKLCMTVDELLAMLSPETDAANLSAPLAGETEDPLNALLGDLMGGEFTYDDSAARLLSTINLGGQAITLDFNFSLDSSRNAHFDRLGVSLNVHAETESVVIDSVIAANITFGDSAPAALTDAEKAEYVDIAAYVDNLRTLFSSDVLRLNVSYAHAASGISLTGSADVDVKDFKVKGTFTLTYGEGTKQVLLQTDGETVYLDLDGVKVKAGLTDISDLLASVGIALPAEIGDDTQTLPLGELVTLLFGDDFAQHLSSAGKDGALLLTVDAMGLLKTFLPDFNLFDLGTVEFTVSENSLSLTVLGASVSLAQGAAFTLETADYTEITKYVQTVIDIVKSENLFLNVAYNKGDLQIEGNVTLNLGESVTASGTLNVTYKQQPHTVEIIYQPDGVYLTIDKAKLTGSVDQVIALVNDILAQTTDIRLPQLSDTGIKTDGLLQKALDKLFGVQLGELLSQLKDENGTLSGKLSGDKVLGMFGVKTDPIDLELTISETEKKVVASAFGVTLTLGTSATAPKTVSETEKANYTSIGDVLDTLSKIVAGKGMAITGMFEVSVGDSHVVVDLQKGGISWEDGFELRFDLVLAVGGIGHKISVYADTTSVSLAYGTVGTTIVYDDFGKYGDIGKAFTALKKKIQGIIDGVQGKDVSAPEEPAVQALALAESGETIMTFVDRIKAFIDDLKSGKYDEAFDINSLLSKIQLTTPDVEGVLLRINVAGANFDLFNPTEGTKGQLGFSVSFAKDDLALSGELTAAPKTDLEAMPSDGVTYLSTSDFVLAIEYLGSAVDLIGARDYTLELSGTTTLRATEPSVDVPAETAEGTQDEGTQGDGGEEQAAPTKYNVKASLQYHNGAGVPVHLNVDESNFWIETSLFLNVHLALVAGEQAAATDKSLYLDLFILDGAPNKDGKGQLVTDGNLDIYLSLSQFASTDEKYSPLKLYAPVDEIMTILSSGVAALGFNLEFLNDYLVNKWLLPETVAQLEAFTPMLSDLMNGLLAGLIPQGDGTEGAEGVALAMSEVTTFKNYIKKLCFEEKKDAETQESSDSLSLVLNSEDVYGVEGLEDLSVTIGRDKDGKFSSIEFANVYDKAGTENTTLSGTFKYNAVTPDIPAEAEKYTSFVGAEKLLLSLVKSATHVTNAQEVISGEAEQHTYAVNENFYIEGSVTANMFGLVNVTIDIVAVSVTIDETGSLGINIRLEYQGMNVGALIAINGDSDVDLTIKDGMIYIKRVQETYYEKSRFGLDATEKGEDTTDDDVTLYRAMPMENFTGDMLNQLSFVLNFGEFIADKISGAQGGGGQTDPKPEEIVDYGKKLTSYTFTEDAEGSKWDLKINGSTFSNGILGKMNVVISADADGYIRKIELPKASPTEINIPVTSTFSLTMNASATLNWRNPGGTMEEGASDKTVDVSGIIEDKTNGMGAMIGKLNAENGWTQTADDGTVTYKFLEAKPYTVSYVYQAARGGGERTLDELTETYLVSTGAYGDAENTLYGSEIVKKDPSTLNTDEYNYTCEAQSDHLLGQAVPSGNEWKIGVTQTICQYTIRFESKKNFGEGWTLMDDGSGIYYLEQSMEYGAVIDIGGQERAVKGEETIVIPEVPMSLDEREGQWTETKPEIAKNHAKFTATYPANVTYKSEIAFTMDGCDVTNADEFWSCTVKFTETDYELLTPSTVGYTFLGWFTCDAEGNWKQLTMLNASEVADVTVEALWAETKYDFTMSGKRDIVGFNKYSYTAEIKETEEKLVGAFADEQISRSVKREYYIGTDTPGYTESDGTEYTVNLSNGSGVKANVRVTVTYTDANGNVLLTIVVEHSGTYDWKGSLS